MSYNGWTTTGNSIWFVILVSTVWYARKIIGSRKNEGFSNKAINKRSHKGSIDNPFSQFITFMNPLLRI